MASWVVVQKGRCPFCACEGKTMVQAFKSKICLDCVAKVYRGEYLPRMEEWFRELEAIPNPNHYVETLKGFVKQALPQKRLS